MKKIIIRRFDEHASPSENNSYPRGPYHFGLPYTNDDAPKHVNAMVQHENDKGIHPCRPFLLTRRKNRSFPSPEMTEDSSTISASYIGIHTRAPMPPNTRETSSERTDHPSFLSSPVPTLFPRIRLTQGCYPTFERFCGRTTMNPNS